MAENLPRISDRDWIVLRATGLAVFGSGDGYGYGYGYGYGRGSL